MIFSLGGFKFQNALIPNDIVKTTDYKITESERINNYVALFAVMKPREEITINCITLPNCGAGNKALEPLYALANKQQSCLLVDGRGKQYGFYVIANIEETISNFMPSGEFLGQEFSITLIRDYKK
ncbi:MAG: phage tail protein [Campylobacteraceae bacterium]|jgi:phage protein U|nr:phage tail protein [Campylobacteraceae bacterium]